MNYKDNFWLMVNFASVVLIISLIEFEHSLQAFELCFFWNILNMVRLGNNKNLTIFYLGTAATAKLITTILHYKLIPFDIGLQEFLILLSCAVTLCIGPFRFFISGECEKKMLFVFLVLTYGVAQYFTLFSNSNLCLYYTCLTGMTTLLLYIFRYKKISSLLLADVYLFMVFLEYNLGYIDAKYMSYSLLYLFSINMIHALLSYLQLSSDSSAKKNLSWLVLQL